MKYSLLFRIWHWLNAIVVIGLVATVILRWTLLAKEKSANLLVEKLSSIHITISYDEGIMLVKALRVGLWDWHIALGLAFALLSLLRLYLHFTNSKSRVAFEDLNRHHKMVRVLYCGLYIVFGIMAITGLLMYFAKDLGLSKDIVHSIKDLHEMVYYYIAIFIPLHIAGVFFADARDEKGLVSTMIHGEDRGKN